LSEAAKHCNLSNDTSHHAHPGSCGCLEYVADVLLDCSEAGKYYQLYPDQKNQQRQNVYGQCLEYGIGVSVDLNEAAKYYKMSADQNDSYGQFHYGLCLEYGKGVSIDLIEATKYYKLSADQCFAPAENQYALSLEFGKGTERNLAQAVIFYERAADRGHSDAQNNFGFFLEYGLGIEPDSVRAARYYDLAAQQQHRGGEYNFARCLEAGRGLDVNLKLAAEYYQRSMCHHDGIVEDNAYRCLRAMNEAEFRPEYFSESQIPSDFVQLMPSEQSADFDLPRTPGTISDLITDSNDYHILSTIDWGATATVHFVKSRSGRQRSAAKIIRSEVYEQSSFLREVELHTQIVHPCVLPLMGFSLPSDTTPAVIYTELVDGANLKAVLERVRECSPPSYWNPTGIAIIVTRIVMGMKCIHSKGIVHRDLKPGNILITSHGKPLIGDFGSARSGADQRTLTIQPGTIHYSAPEVFTDRQYGSKVDVFSFGSVLYEIFTGCSVFPTGEFPERIMYQLISHDLPEIPDAIGDSMKGLITNCWKLDPDERPTFNDILNELDSINFMILPGVSMDLVRQSVQEVVDWEVRRANWESQSIHPSLRSPDHSSRIHPEGG
jgi:serine/threonine protein kinase